MNSPWRALFSETKAHNLIALHSDHSALFLKVHIWKIVRQPKRFRFENALFREVSCAQVISTAWNNSNCHSILYCIQYALPPFKYGVDLFSGTLRRGWSFARFSLTDRGLFNGYSTQQFPAASREYSIILNHQEDFLKQGLNDFGSRQGIWTLNISTLLLLPANSEILSPSWRV